MSPCQCCPGEWKRAWDGSRGRGRRAEARGPSLPLTCPSSLPLRSLSEGRSSREDSDELLRLSAKAGARRLGEGSGRARDAMALGVASRAGAGSGAAAATRSLGSLHRAGGNTSPARLPWQREKPASRGPPRGRRESAGAPPAPSQGEGVARRSHLRRPWQRN